VTLILLEPGLRDLSGEAAIEAMAIAREATRRGEPVLLLAARDCRGDAPAGMRVIPFFAPRSAAACDDPVTGRFDAFTALNDLLAEDLARLPRAETRATDAVLALHAGVDELAGLAAWMKAFHPLDAPLLFVRLAAPRLGEGRGHAPPDAMELLCLRLGLRALEAEGPPVHLSAAGRALARDLGAWTGREVAMLPLPFGPEVPETMPAAARVLAVLAPDGAANLEPMLRALAAAHPGWTVTPVAQGEALPAGAALILVLPGPRPEPARALWEALALGTPMLLPQGSWMAREAALWGEFLGAYPPGATPEQIARHASGAIHRLDELRGMAAQVAARFRAENGAAALMDGIGRLWAARIAAAALLVREREAALDVAAMRGAGWHKLETEDGQPMRWTAREPVIAFDWPYLVPWQLRLRLRHWHGDAQLRGIEAFAGGERLAATVVRDAGGPVIRVEGRPGDPLDPRTELRIVLPFAHRPADDPRELGVMVSAITLRAAQDMARGAATLPAAGVRAAPEPDGGWTIYGVLSGEVVADGREPVGLALRLEVPGGPDAARSLALHLEGTPVRLDITALGGPAFSALATLPHAILRRAGLVAAWDLVAPPGEAAIRLRSVDAVRLAGTAATPLASGPGLVADAQDADGAAAPQSGRRRSPWWRGR